MEYIIIGVLVILLLIGLSIANFSGAQFEDTFDKYNKVPSNIGMTGGELALNFKEILFKHDPLEVRRTAGHLTDAYSCKSKMVILSEATCDISSVSALAVVAHEFGHALQDRENSKKFVFNRRLAIVTRYLGYFMLPLILVGIFMLLIKSEEMMIGFSFIIAAGVIFILALILKISTIRIEKDASMRGLDILIKNEILDSDEIVMAKAVLKAALLTYIADFLRVILAWTMLAKKTQLFY